MGKNSDIKKKGVGLQVDGGRSTCLCAVAMVNVIIHNRHPFQPVLGHGVQCAQRHVIK